MTDNTNNLGQSASTGGPAGASEEQVLNPNQAAATGGAAPGSGAASETHRVNQPIAIRSTSSEARR